MSKKQPQGVYWTQLRGGKDDPDVLHELQLRGKTLFRVGGNSYIGSYATYEGDNSGALAAFRSVAEAKGYCEECLRDRASEFFGFLVEVDDARRRAAVEADRAVAREEKALLRKLQRKHG